MFKWFSTLFTSEEKIEIPSNVIRAPISSLRIVRVELSHDELLTNPATGLPMQEGAGGLDTLGNPFGVDLDIHDTLNQSLRSCDPFNHSGICDGW